MGDSLSNAAPVSSVGGFPRPSNRELPKRQGASDHEDEAEKHAADQDGVELHSGPSMARRMLRERVLSRTRDLLDLKTGDFVPSFAENVDEEPVPAFLGRLIGAQNQLAALRVRQLPSSEIRSRLDRALRDGIEEAMELLAQDSKDGTGGCEFVANVLAEYGRRIADLLLEDC